MTERKRNMQIKKMSDKRIKADVSSNSDRLDDVISEHRTRSLVKEKFPLRINANTVIFVAREKCTREYAENYLNRMNRSVRESYKREGK